MVKIIGEKYCIYFIAVGCTVSMKFAATHTDKKETEQRSQAPRKMWDRWRFENRLVEYESTVGWLPAYKFTYTPNENDAEKWKQNKNMHTNRD